MKAFLLAAGMGTRLRPLTIDTPKCLIDIKGKPLLHWWLELIEQNNVDEVLINTCYLHEKVEEFLMGYKGKVSIIAAYENQLLGSAGTIRENIGFVKNEEDFLILYSDNLTNVNLNDMMHFHKAKKSGFTIGVFYANKPRECGIAIMNDDALITEFEEKPQTPKSNLSNAGIYVVNKSMISYFISDEPFDIGRNILPKLVNKMYGYQIKEYLTDIGTIDNYMRALKEWGR